MLGTTEALRSALASV